MVALARPFGALDSAGAGLVLIFESGSRSTSTSTGSGTGGSGSIALWFVTSAAGRQTGVVMSRAAEGGVDAEALRRRGVALHALTTVGVLAILALMIFKPGA